MSENTECLLKEIVKQLTILNDRVVSRTNAHFLIEFDTNTFTTGTGRKFSMKELFGIEKANDLSILSLGGGFSISKNGETPLVTGSLNLVYEDEDIYSINLLGAAAAGTAIIRIGAYLPRI